MKSLSSDLAQANALLEEEMAAAAELRKAAAEEVSMGTYVGDERHWLGYSLIVCMPLLG